MNTKKIWVLAIIFGLVMSLLFLFLTTINSQSNSTNPPANEEEIDDETPEPNANSLVIEDGKRAISIPVDESQTVSGFVQPGSFVDIISVANNTISQILIQNVKILAVGKTIVKRNETETAEPYDMVTLELSPPEATKLTLARQNGVVTLMLRGTEDHEPSPANLISLEQLTKGQVGPDS